MFPSKFNLPRVQITRVFAACISSSALCDLKGSQSKHSRNIWLKMLDRNRYFLWNSVDWLALVYFRFVGITSAAPPCWHPHEHQATSFGVWVWVEWCSNAWWQTYHLDLSVGNSTVLVQSNPFRSLFAFSIPWGPGINYQMKLQSHSDCAKKLHTVTHLIPTMTQH